MSVQLWFSQSTKLNKLVDITYYVISATRRHQFLVFGIEKQLVVFFITPPFSFLFTQPQYRLQISDINNIYYFSPGSHITISLNVCSSPASVVYSWAYSSDAFPYWKSLLLASNIKSLTVGSHYSTVCYSVTVPELNSAFICVLNFTVDANICVYNVVLDLD